MKIVTRQQFGQMPKGTVFCKFPLKNQGDGERMLFGINTPNILYDKIFDDEGNLIDFICTELGLSMTPKGEDMDNFESMFYMQDHVGEPIPFEHSIERDGMYDDNNVGFAIFSKEEVEEIVEMLQESLKTAYK